MLKKQKKKFNNVKYLILLLIFLIIPFFVFAGNPAIDKLTEVGSTKGPYATVDEFGASKIIGQVILGALSLIGVIFLILMIYAGYQWMTAQGDEEKVTKARVSIIHAVIGIVVVVSAYTIWYFIYARLIYNS